MREATARRGGRGVGETDYFASMTDLMLGLVFVFIIMLMAFALNMREAEHKMADAAQSLGDADLARRELLRELARLLEGTLPVAVDEENGTLQLGGDVLFPKGSADAYPDALSKLRMLGAALNLVLPCYARAEAQPAPARCAGRPRARLDALLIEGHTDTSPIRTPRFQSNWDLAAARASETYGNLVAAYPTLAEIRNDRGERLIGVSGYGPYRPLDESGTPEAMQRNRRVELRFLMAAPNTAEVDRVIAEVRAGKAP